MPTAKKQEKVMIDPEHANQVVNAVLSQFATEEIGNKVTQFNMQGLANIMVGALNNPDSLKKPEPKIEATEAK